MSSKRVNYNSNRLLPKNSSLWKRIKLSTNAKERKTQSSSLIPEDSCAENNIYSTQSVEQYDNEQFEETIKIHLKIKNSDLINKILVQYTNVQKI